MEKLLYIDILSKVAQQHPQWNWFAIADSAQNKALPASLMQVNGQVRCLLGATQGSPLAQESPHLVALPRPIRDGGAWQWMGQNATRKPSSVTVVASLLSFDALFAQLKQFTEIRLPDGTEMFFAFWDPAILGTLIGQADDATLHIKGPLFDLKQRSMLYGGLKGWWYWDRDSAMHSVALDADAPVVRVTKPLMLTQEQVDQLVEASVPDHVLYYVDLNQPHLLTDIPPRQRYGYVERSLRGARDIGLETMNDMVNYVCAALIYGDRWHHERAIIDLLAQVKRGDMKFSAALELLP